MTTAKENLKEWKIGLNPIFLLFNNLTVLLKLVKMKLWKKSLKKMIMDLYV